MTSLLISVILVRTLWRDDIVRDFSLIDADNFSVGFCATFDGDTRFSDVEMFGKKLN